MANQTGVNASKLQLPTTKWQRKVSIDALSPRTPCLSQRKSSTSSLLKQFIWKTPLKTPGKTPKKGVTPKKPVITVKSPPKDVPVHQGDRFIPNRRDSEYDLCHFQITLDEEEEEKGEESEDTYKSAIADSLNIPAQKESKILSFKQRAPIVGEGYLNRNKVLYYSSATKGRPKGNGKRHIPEKSERILDAPGLRNDFYVTLIDWGADNLLAVALNDEVYLWNANNGEIVLLMNINDSDLGAYISSVAWITQGKVLAIGNSLGNVQLWDVEHIKCLRNMTGHADSVGVLSWNSYILTSGSKAGKIHHHDVRIADHHLATLDNHDQSICGLQWSPDGCYLASGGNDNVLNIWDGAARTGSDPLFSLTHHQAAVKAISWCPWKPQLLASGGGAADRTIRLWAAHTGSCLKTTDTGSQVSGILWSEEHREIASGHGYSQNEITLWKYPNMDKIASLHGHSDRILNMCLSPDKSMIATAGADETLQFWKCFQHNPKRKVSTSKETKESTSTLSSRMIR